MSNTDTLNATARADIGSRAAKKLRAAGQVPAVVYGHGIDPVSISVPTSEIDAMIRRGSRIVDLVGAIQENAFVKEVQWDSFGVEVLHLDFTRVARGEKVELSVAVELRGTAPGTRSGGIVSHQLHEVEISCPAQSIPEKLEVNINSLELDQSVTAGDLPLPEDATLITDGSSIVVQCVEPVAERDEESAVELGIEPEVIGRKAEEEGESEA